MKADRLLVHLWRCALLLLVLAPAAVTHAKEAAPAAEDPALERRVMTLAAELRCLVCQNQSLADSNAPLAVDLRNQVREQMRQGRSEQEIVQYLVERYGDFVLFRPPFKAATVLLWLGPALLLIAGLAALYRLLARRRRAALEARLSEEERARAEALLASGPRDRESADTAR
jgi:cytochrome c-type biogenesis protein CcmH